MQFDYSCILFSTADWDEPYWTNKQHTAKALANLGVRVLYVESVGLRAPKGNSRRDWQRLKSRLLKGISSLLKGAIQREANIYVLSPLLVPAGYRHPLLRKINKFLLRLAISRSMSAHSLTSPLIWTYHPFMMDVFSKEQYRNMLYHCVDDLSAVPGIDPVSFRSAEVELLKTAKVIFATAPALAERCQLYNDSVYYLPNVVDFEHFNSATNKASLPTDLANIPLPRLIYHGVLSDFKINFALLHESAQATPDWSWIFIGEQREGQNSKEVERLRKLPNVHFLGYRSYAEIPSYLNHSSVGLLPTLVNDYTKSMFPMKFFEYIAAGLPVVSTSLDALLQHHPSALEFGDDAKSFCRSIEMQLKAGKISSENALEIIGENTWRDRTKKMLEQLVEG